MTNPAEPLCCIPRRLPDHEQAPAAARAVQIRVENHPEIGPDHGPLRKLTPRNTSEFVARVAHRQSAKAIRFGGTVVRFPARVFVWREKLGLASCPYLIRWVLDFRLFSIRLHHWIGSDDARHFHDHPWSFLTLVLAGSYEDVSPEGRERLSAGCIRFRKAEHRHTVQVSSRGCWSLLLTGPERRIWGFWVEGQFRRREKYFKKHGHHQCQ